MSKFLLDKNFTKNLLSQDIKINGTTYGLDVPSDRKFDAICNGVALRRELRNPYLKIIASCITDKEISEICRQLHYVDPDFFDAYTADGKVEADEVAGFLDDYYDDYDYKATDFKADGEPVCKERKYDLHLMTKEDVIVQALMLDVLDKIMNRLHELEAASTSKHTGNTQNIHLTTEPLYDYFYGTQTGRYY